MLLRLLVVFIVCFFFVSADVPKPTARQLAWMEFDTIQFMHFGIPTFWDPPTDFLYTANPTYHDCYTTKMDHSNQTKDYYPCLHPDVFNPTDLNADDWMEASKAMGMGEICLTAHHEGGFALWPSNFTDYSVQASKWRNGKGDVLREFVDAANRWGIAICYYLNVQDDGYMVDVAKYDGEEFIRRQVGMVKEVLLNYGPVNRFWFDGTKGVPSGTNVSKLWSEVYSTIRTVSPNTLISAYRGDICASTGSLFMNSGPPPNTTDTGTCRKPSEKGKYFHPTEMHGITMQEGPDGNTNEKPTYWFWHPWACAGNKTGCPWIGHGNASRIFSSYLNTVGHGAVLNMNIPPERTGRMNRSVNEVMHQVGLALNNTFKRSVVKKEAQRAQCVEGAVVLEVEGKPFDYVLTMEELANGQRIANYSVDFTRVGSEKWEVLIPLCDKNKTTGKCNPPKQVLQGNVGDRPDGSDPRDQYIGRKRIDFPIVHTSGKQAVKIDKVRFNCHRTLVEPIYLRQFSLHKKTVPWE